MRGRSAMTPELWDKPHYSFCLVHHTVESSENRCRSDQRLGPFDSYDEAAGALDLAHKRTEAWDAEDD